MWPRLPKCGTTTGEVSSLPQRDAARLGSRVCGRKGDQNAKMQRCRGGQIAGNMAGKMYAGQKREGAGVQFQVCREDAVRL